MVWFWVGLIVRWAVCASGPEHSLPGPWASAEHPSQICISNKVEFSGYLERKGPLAAEAGFPGVG